jgi:two-component system, NarL family, response regulator DegU
MSNINILIADDHPLFRLGVKKELENYPEFTIAAETGDGREAYELIRKLNIDAAILDFQMPGLDGLQITGKLREEKCRTKLILLTMHCDKKIFQRAVDSGIDAYVLKDDAVLDIVNAVRAVLAGETFISSGMAAILVKDMKKQAGKDSTEKLINELTTSEKNILSLIAALNTNTEIADRLFLSKRTIENHKVSIARKLQLKSSKELLRFALQNKDKITP